MMDQIGRYRIVGELGRGAMGVVYLATDPSIGRYVAIKTIRMRDIDDTQQRERLRVRLFREARSAGILSHPNIVTIYDMDEVDGLAYIAMAYVNGPTLEKVLASDQALSGSRMLGVLRQTAMALDYAHARGIVHRDVKPANIMTDEDGSVKITDFGIARMATGAHSNETRTIAGTPNYMSPEQVQGFSVDGRSDQFSLAVIAYEILTGERPFAGEHLSTIVYKIVGEEPPGAHRLNGTLTVRIDEVLRKALAKKPEARFPTCSNFVGALELACAESRGWKTLPAGASGAMPTLAIDRAPEKPQPPSAPAERVMPPPPAALPAATPSLGGPSMGVPLAGLPSAGVPRDIPPPARSSGLLPLLMSLFVVAGVAAVFLYQAGLLGHSETPAATPASVQPPAENSTSGEPRPAPFPPAPDAGTDKVPEAAAARGESDKPPDPSPVEDTTPAEGSARAEPKPAPSEPVPAQPEPVVVAPEAAPPVRKTAPMVHSRVQDIRTATDPTGAKVVLDDNLKLSCITPCALLAGPGEHQLTFSRAGYLNEYRQVRVAGSPVEVPLVSLKQPAGTRATGTLMLSTTPPGARVRIDGQLMPETTPAQLPLRSGNYTVTVEKDGVSRTERIQIHESPYYLRIPLNP